MNNTLKLPKITKSNNHTYDANDIKHLISQIKDKSQESIVKEAIQVGYLIFPNKEYIWKEYESQIDYEPSKVKKTEKNDFSQIKFLKLSNVPIVELGDLFLCTNLRILNLSSNYLMNIESLAGCVNLIRLDLQNNQVTNLWQICNTIKIALF
jgi:Leucine-rich repeat (LRR) protein